MNDVTRIGDYYYYIGTGFFGTTITKYKETSRDEDFIKLERVDVLININKIKVFKNPEEARNYLEDIKDNHEQQ